MYETLDRFIRHRSGATAIEYGLIAGIIAVCLMTAMASLTSDFATGMTKIADALKP